MADSHKKRKRAAALSYDPESHGIPVLSAFGEGYVAEKIIEKAEEAGVPIIPDAGLANMLAKMSVGDDIPPNLYEVVAKILIFLGEIDQKYKEKMESASR